MMPSKLATDVVLITALLAVGALADHRNRRFPVSLAFGSTLLLLLGGAVVFVGVTGSHPDATGVGAWMIAGAMVGLLAVARCTGRRR
jgi:hypothetical protein